MRRSYNPPAITARLESAGGGTPHAALRSGRGVRIWSRRHRSAGAGANLSIEASQNHRALCARRFDRRGCAAQWVAAFAPSAVPADIIETLRKAFVAAMSV